MRKRELFRRLGYPKHSDAVYDVLVTAKDPILVSHIAKQTHLARMTVYRCLNALARSGLVRKEKVGKRNCYIATGAAALKRVVRIEEAVGEKAIESDLKRFEKNIPRSVRFLRGPEGIRAAFDDVVAHTKRGETFFRYTSEQDLARVNQYLARDYRERRDKKKLERKVISNALSGNQKRSRLERFVKFIPEEADQFQQNIIQLVYGNRISIIDLETEEVTVIENERLAEFQKTIFSLLYKRL